MRLSTRLDKLEAQRLPGRVTKVWIATEDEHTGLFRMDDGRTLTQKALDALPHEGPGLAGIIVYMPRGTSSQGTP